MAPPGQALQEAKRRRFLINQRLKQRDQALKARELQELQEDRDLQKKLKAQFIQCQRT